ncbi:DUF1361 domain-containing protein [Occultella glacieicola]|uniref:DUF1361 domain-containing protein n=1 Tax=Occultella glacieicola TaxID=2518684 RepID=A0ABY2DXD2_9MICO|nr:DUF1361 domain-containing protein [Occultella glacieicola]TDE88009.1 DUF1361 domain-containing protein [Occultella glacieicola]
MLTSLVLGVVGMNAFALVLILVRAPMFHARLYTPMLWNVTLSVAPVLLMGLLLVVVPLLVGVQVWLAVVAGVILGVGWLLLLPNAGYLITELNMSHRREEETVPMWFDVVQVISLAMSGVLNTVLNVFLAQLLFVLLVYGDVAAPLQAPVPRLIVVAILLAVSFGMYLGRHVRLNSWDVRHPTSLVRKVATHLRGPGRLRSVTAFVVLYTVFLGLMYLAVAGPVVEGLVLLEVQRG